MGFVVDATPRPLHPRERPGTPLGAPQGQSGRMRENFAPHRDSIPGPSNPYRIAISTELSRPVRRKISDKFKICECWSCNIDPYLGNFAFPLTLIIDREVEGWLQLPDVKGGHCILLDKGD
jgi:hypothetical protein